MHDHEHHARTLGGFRLSQESCGICGGDGRIGNSFGLTTSCPSCHGTGRRVAPTGLRDVTKTKPSHFLPTNKTAAAPKATWPNTFEGGELAKAVTESKSCTAEVKSRLIREIMDHEDTHGRCTQTFIKKTRRAAGTV
jgi:hypothetical protein